MQLLVRLSVSATKKSYGHACMFLLFTNVRHPIRNDEELLERELDQNLGSGFRHSSRDTLVSRNGFVQNAYRPHGAFKTGSQHIIRLVRLKMVIRRYCSASICSGCISVAGLSLRIT